MSDRNFSLIPGFQLTTFTPEDLENIIAILKKYEVEAVKLNTSKRLSLSGPKGAALEALTLELEELSLPRPQNAITYVQACPGEDVCKYGIRDSQEVAGRIEMLQLPTPLPAKVKIGVAGCMMCCTEPYVRDIGLIAQNTGWKLTFGGNGGGRPRVGDTIANGLNDDQVVELAHRCLLVYIEHGRPKMRTARFMESFGADRLKNAVLDKPL